VFKTNKKTMKKIIIGVITLAVVAGGVVLFNNINKTENNNNKNTQNNMLSGLIIEKIANKTTKFGEGIEAVLYKEPGCSCCEGYAKELRTQGFDVKVVPTKDIDSVKNKYKIPTDKQSCHTVAINNYFVEGHVPMKAVRELLEQKSEIKGI